MARDIGFRDGKEKEKEKEKEKRIVKAKPKQARGEITTVKRDSATGLFKVNSTQTGKPRVSAKTLKSRAMQGTREMSPAGYLGIKMGARPVRLSQLVADGLPASAAESLAGNLEVSVAELIAKYVHIPKQTMARRRNSGKFNEHESDRVVRFASLLKYTTDMMEGDQAAAIQWLKTPDILLEDQTPLEYARTESGAAEVQQLIGRIEAGVYS